MMYYAGMEICGGQEIPEPTTIFLLGFGLIGLAGFRRKKLKWAGTFVSALFVGGDLSRCSQIHGGFCHLALTKLGQKDFIHCLLSTTGTDNGFLEIWTHGCLVNSDCSHFAIEFLLAPFAFKVDFHVVSILFFSPNQLLYCF